MTFTRIYFWDYSYLPICGILPWRIYFHYKIFFSLSSKIPWHCALSDASAAAILKDYCSSRLWAASILFPANKGAHKNSSLQWTSRLEAGFLCCLVNVPTRSSVHGWLVPSHRKAITAYVSMELTVAQAQFQVLLKNLPWYVLLLPPF